MYFAQKSVTFWKYWRSIIRGFHWKLAWNLTFCAIFDQKPVKKLAVPTNKNRYVLKNCRSILKCYKWTFIWNMNTLYSPKESSMKNSSSGSHIWSRFSRYLLVVPQLSNTPTTRWLYCGGRVGGRVFPPMLALFLIREFYSPWIAYKS